MLAFFLILHVSSVLFGRAVLNLDTNYHYTAAGLHVPPNHLFFVPYYFLAAVALFAHLGCAAYWQLQKAATRTLVVVLTLVVGTGVSLLITLSLAGKIHPVEDSSDLQVNLWKIAAVVANRWISLASR